MEAAAWAGEGMCNFMHLRRPLSFNHIQPLAACEGFLHHLSKGLRNLPKHRGVVYVGAAKECKLKHFSPGQVRYWRSSFPCISSSRMGVAVFQSFLVLSNCRSFIGTHFSAQAQVQSPPRFVRGPCELFCGGNALATDRWFF